MAASEEALLGRVAGPEPGFLLSRDSIASAVKPLITVAEKRFQLPPLPIIVIGNAVDLETDQSQLNELDKLCKGYEEECFEAVVQDLEPDQIAFGPHLLNAAFDGVKVGIQKTMPDIEKKRFSIPDTMVFELELPDVNNFAILRIVRLVEARTGRINGNGKIEGFKNLMAGIRKYPQYFTYALDSVLRGRLGIASTILLTAPPDGEISVDFYSPREYIESQEKNRQEYLVNNPFRKPIGYKTIPLPLFETAA